MKVWVVWQFGATATSAGMRIFRLCGSAAMANRCVGILHAADAKSIQITEHDVVMTDADLPDSRAGKDGS